MCTSRAAQRSREYLSQVLDKVAHLLPSQGPIGVFVHHNTLHAFEHMPFEEAVVEAGRLFGAEPFMSEGWYRQRLAEGRIELEDVDAVVTRQCHDRRIADRSVADIRRALMVRGIVRADPRSMKWLLEDAGMLLRFVEDVDPPLRCKMIAETKQWLMCEVRTARAPHESFVDWLADEAPERFVERRLGAVNREHLEQRVEARAETAAVVALWSATTKRVAACAPVPAKAAGVAWSHPRDLLLQATDRDADEIVAAVLVPAVASFLDQGVAYWPMPDRSRGFYEAMRDLVVDGPALPSPFLNSFKKVFARYRDRRLDAEEVMMESLDECGIEPERWYDALLATALALPGWSGIMSTLEREPHLVPHDSPPCRLVDFLAVRLLLDRLAWEHVATHELAHRGSLAALWEQLRAKHRPVEDRRPHLAFELFQLAQLLGISGPRMLDLADEEVRLLLDELKAFGERERRKAWHLAYERRHRLDFLGALGAHQRVANKQDGLTPRLQAVFCIDEREESIRRHLEEQSAAVETFGAAGFFGVAISYRGLDDGHHASLCPVAVQPQHEIVELAVAADGPAEGRYRARRKLWAALSRGTFVGSRALVRGWAATVGLGVLSAVPLTVRVLFPRFITRLDRRLQSLFFPPPRTELALQRDAEERGSLALFPGFTVDEMTDRVERVLQDMGLVRGFAPLVAIVGHGSSSLNNPHESAHDCGACGGRRGGPNARLFALMANHPEVRRNLRLRGLEIPASTAFVGAYHDTCNDDIVYFDLDGVPESHLDRVDELRALLDRARRLSAHERCRRFDSVALDTEPDAALLHVEGRAENLAEPRPEYGHATNAVCVFGRRERTRGLFLDRRAFLVSYDPTIDPEAEILGRLLAAMGPVGAGINLEYYFSFVDNERYGCGTKLPHNVTGLLGVMNGHLSDLRTGLPWQMVEIHEPVRLLVIIEASPAAIAKVCERYPGVYELVKHRWIQLALIDPDDGTVTEYIDGEFKTIAPDSMLPKVESSLQWYRRRRDHLRIARIVGSPGSRTQP